MPEHRSRIWRMTVLYDLLEAQEDLEKGCRAKLNKLVERSAAYLDAEEIAKVRHEVSTKN